MRVEIKQNKHAKDDASMDFVGREKELKTLEQCYNSAKNELVAVYGRRRVGKTALVEEAFSSDFFFRHVGVRPQRKKNNGEKVKEEDRPMVRQLSAFANSFLLSGAKKRPRFSSWIEAFTELILFIKAAPAEKRKVIFIDELPWMDTPKSRFLESFEWLLNNVLPQRLNVCIVIAGSSASWMLDNVIDNDAGIYHRVTERILLKPMNLYECELLLQKGNTGLPRYQIAQAYMALGGVPHYLIQFNPGLSLTQNISKICFQDESDGESEFSTLFSSMFDESKKCEAICRFLSNRSKGYSRSEICAGTGIADNQLLSDSLKALEKGSFILKYVPYQGNEKEPMYKLIDPFCIFYLSQVEEHAKSRDSDAWLDIAFSAEGNAWKGYAFENLCFCHLNQIKKALGIQGVRALAANIVFGDEESGKTQIDMVIERKDMIVDLCEMKFVSSPFAVDLDYHEKLMKRVAILRKVTPGSYAIRQVLITSFGLKRTGYADDFQNVIDLNDLFKPD